MKDSCLLASFIFGVKVVYFCAYLGHEIYCGIFCDLDSVKDMLSYLGHEIYCSKLHDLDTWPRYTMYWEAYAIIINKAWVMQN